MEEKRAHTEQQSPAIRVEKLNKSFGDNHVLQDFDLELKNGENLVVLGKSGSGKSVLIKCIVGLIPPDSGKISVLGEDVTSLEHKELDQVRRRLGFLFQGDALYDSMTIRENLEFMLRTEKAKSEDEVEKLVLDALKQVGLEKTVDMMPSELSGGMKKRIALARTLIRGPEIILYDEPTSGLDPVTGREISKLIVEVQKHYKASSIVISHDLHCARRVSDRVAVLIDGRCRAIGTYEEMKKADDPDVRQFFEEEL